LAHWFDLTDIARQRFAQSGWDVDALRQEAASRVCPYDIDVARKFKLTLAKLRDEPTNVL
jgi:isocitrate dehydrogenase kinase/phosphatase